MRSETVGRFFFSMKLQIFFNTVAQTEVELLRIITGAGGSGTASAHLINEASFLFIYLFIFYRFIKYFHILSSSQKKVWLHFSWNF